MPNRAAVVIGINYTPPPGDPAAPPSGARPTPLLYAEEDAKAVAALLEAEGFQVKKLVGTEATQDAIIDTIEDQSDKSTHADDLIVVYFAGHGIVHVKNADIAYLMPHGADPKRLSSTAIALHSLPDYLNTPGKALVLLDCCHAGYALGWRGHAQPAQAAEEFRKRARRTFTDLPGRIIVAACAGDELARELAELKQGAFTYYMMEWWRKGRSGTDLNLYEYVSDALKGRALPGPVRGGDQEAPIVLRDRRTDSESLEEQPPEKTVIEKQARLRAMLSDHSSFMRDRLQGFVGREAELTEIRRRIAEKQPTGGYVTITGQAGQGKSSVMARLVQDAGPDSVAHHFIPFSPGPDHQVSLLRDLMARLILKHDLSEIYVAGESRPALRDFFPNLLTEIAKRGQQETIYIDGLDQIELDSNGTRDLSFLPTDPPPGIVFVLSTRPDDTLRPLELRKALAEYKLPALTRVDFEHALEGRGLHLDPGMIARVYDAMGGNALYLHLVVEELAAAGATSAEEIIHRVVDDPNNLFSLSIDRFKRAGQLWREVIRPVLGVLLAAQEPLLPAHLRAILGMDYSDLRDGLRRLGGLVAEDGRDRRYLFHLKLRDYLHEDPSNPNDDFVFAADEEAYFHRQLADWCERGGLPAIWQDTKSDPAEQGRREYARQHYVTHLYHTGDWERLAAVLDAGDYGRAKVHHDPSTRSYVQDLDLGRHAAARPDLGLEEGLARLPHLWRYTLLRTSLTSRVDNYPDAAFPTLVLLGREQEVIGLAELLTDPAKKAQALGRIAEQLQKREGRAQEARVLLLRAYDVLSQITNESQKISVLETLLKISNLADGELATRVEALARAMPDGYYRASALASMAAALTAVGQPQAAPLFRDAETIASAIKLDRERGYALRSVAAALAAAGQLTQAEVVALSISDDPHGTTETRDRVLADVAKALAVSGQIKRGEALACNLKSKAARVTALAGVARALSAIGQTEHAMLILVDAEAAARTTGQDSRIEALVDVAKAMAACGRSEQANQLYAEAEAFAESLSGDRAHAWSTSRQMEPFVSLAEILTAAGQIERAEAIARTMPPDKLRADTLANLAWVLAASGQTERAIEMFADVETLVRTILTTSEQISALENLAEALVKARQWAQAEVVARAIPNDIGEPGMRLLMFIARALADAGRIEDAEALACKIEGTGWQGEALVSVAKALATAGQIDRAQALAISLEHNAAQVEALAVVARVLVTVGETKRAMQILADATTAARSIEHDYWRAKALSELGRARVAIGQIEYANQVFISIQALNYNPFFYSKADRAEVLDDMARALAASKQTRLAMLIFVRIETAARLEKMVGRRVQALADVGRMLAVADRMDQANRVFADAEFIVYAIKGDSLQAEALAYVGERRAEALAYIGRKLAATGQTEQAIQVFSDAEATARAIKVRFPDEALAVVVEALVTAGQIKRAEAITRAMEKHWAQSNRHAHLITALVKNRRYEQGLRLAQRSLLEATNRASALQNLAIATPFIPTKPELGMSFFEAFAWVDKFLQG